MPNVIDRLSLGAKLLLAPGSALLLMVALALGGFLGMKQQQATLIELVEVRTPNLMSALALEQQAKALHAGLYQYLSWKSASYSEQRTGELGKTLLAAGPKLTNDVRTMAGRTDLLPLERDLLQQASASADAFARMVPEVLDMSDTDQSIATTMMLKAEAPFGALVEKLQSLKQSQVEQNASAAAGNAKSFKDATALGLVALVISAMVSGLITWQVRRSILRSVQAISATASKLREGDLRVAVSVEGSDEVAMTARAMSETMVSLRQTIGSIHLAVGQIDHAVSEIVAGNENLSERTERQATNLQKTNSNMSIIATAVNVNADNARSAAELAMRSCERTERSGRMVNEVVEVMNTITESSKQVQDIIGVINNIAFQTNILALNAAVEAARAGEQGRGFAVVASEVRTLAQRSAQAASEIKQLLSESAERVASGGALVTSTGEAMREVVDDVRRLSTLIDGISRANKDQNVGVKDVASMLSELDTTTQQNALLVEQASAAASSMRQESARLVDAVSMFKTQATPA